MNLKEKAAGFIHRMGISANALTFLGLALALAASFLIYRGYWFWAGGVLLLSGGVDLLDGAVARVSGTQSKFGGILDSSLDRLGDGAVLGAFVFYFLQQQKVLIAGFAMSALIGAFLVSYVRARAECEIENCRVGFWERGERIVYLALGLLLNNIIAPVVVLGIGTHWTAVQRLWRAKTPDTASIQKPLSRKSTAYFVKCFALLLLLFLKKF